MGTPTVNGIPIQRFGLTEVYRPPGPVGTAKVDLVLIHGLSGRPYETWLSKNTNAFWPSQLLPPWIEEQKIRVLVYGYDADVTTTGSVGVTKDKIHNHAERLIADLVANRRMRKALERPLIFIAHSLGGLVLKRALISSSEVTGIKTEHLRSVYVSTYGILFFGTPHKGSDIAAWGSYLEWLCRAVIPKKVIDSAPQFVDALKKDSETLQNIDRQFANLLGRFHLFFFHEAKPTDFKGTLRFVVEEDSAAPSLPDIERAGIQADHSNMCKFDSENSSGFDLIVDAIQRYADESEATIKNHWATERKERQLYKELLAQGLFPTQTGSPPSESGSIFQYTPDSSFHGELINSHIIHHESPNPNSGNPSPRLPSEPYFYVPAGFRPNSLFVGMQRELQDLDLKLFDRRRREEGTAAVLLYGPAGAGKSHVARQYVHNQRIKFNGGIFWITARSVDEMVNDYWQIAQKYVAKDSPDLRLTTEGTGRDTVDVVKMWFESRSEWLIVFDGLTVETNQEVAELTRFVPNRPHSSLIYISMSDELKSRHRLLNPVAIKVRPLSEGDAREMLFRELGLRPNPAQIQRATELVKEVGGLPLAINAISHRLAATHEKLERYRIQSYSADPKLGGPYRQIMTDLFDRHHVEAWNLIHVLCFWGEHIPVEMINFGLKSLKRAQVEVRSSETGGKRDINTTYAILIRFALIDRNEPEDRGSASSSRDSLYSPDPIDTLKVHTVVQNFCCDELKLKGDLPQWLSYAVGLFCLSYDEADHRISRKPQPGLVSDYREYLSHGKYLRRHVLKYLRKSPELETVHTTLEYTMEKIDEEIRRREPGSSQESVKSVEFQTSVFDRSSSSSSSGHSDIKNRGNNHRSQIANLSLDGSSYVVADELQPFESPSSIRTNSPTHQQRPEELDPQMHATIGYQGDGTWGDSLTSVPMEETLSDVTARPYTPRQDSLWPLMKSNRPYSPHKDLGTFRPSPVQAEVDRNLAVGSVVKPLYERRGSLSGSSNAINSLTAVHRASPPRSRGGGAIRTTDRPPQSLRSRPTWAEVAAQTARPSQPTQSLSNGSWEEDMPNPSRGLEGERGRPLASRPVTATVEQSSFRSGLTTRSRAVTESRPISLGLSRDGSSNNLSQFPQSSPLRQNASFDPVHTPHAALTRENSSNDLSRSLSSLPQHVYNYQPPNISGLNPAPLPYESDITIRRTSTTSPRPIYQATFQPPAYPYSTSLGQRFGAATSAPRGYYSQPVSRVHSDHSNSSSAATEPPLPHALPPSPFFQAALLDSGSIRSRLPNGAPMGKSPKFASSSSGFRPRTSSSDNAMYDPPLSPYELANTTSLTYRDIKLQGPSGTAHAASQAATIHFSPGPSDYGSPQPPSSAPMSRGSSGAGGFAIDDSIVEFGHNGEVIFGMMEPLKIEDVRRRNRERELELNSRRGSNEMWEEREGLQPDALGIMRPRRDSVAVEIRGGSSLPATTPYPDINRIPTDAAESRAVVDSPPPGPNRTSPRSINYR